MYKQKLKHVLSEHHNTTSELKTDSVTSASLIQNQHTESELGLQREKHGLQADLREKNLHNEHCIKMLKQVSVVSFLHFRHAVVSCFCHRSVILLILNRNTRLSSWNLQMTMKGESEVNTPECHF